MAPKILHDAGAGYDGDEVTRVVRALADEDLFTCVLGIPTGSVAPNGAGSLPAIVLPGVSADGGLLKNFWQARAMATEVERWLKAWPDRIFHAHSRAGLGAALWLSRRGQSRVVASVHAYDKRRWVYRWAARTLTERLFWLTPAMKHYYCGGAKGEGWAQCIPACVPLRAPAARERGEGKIVRVGGIGPMISRKCWHLVLDALAAMPAMQRWKVRFDHVGGADGTEKSRRYEMALRTQAGALSLGNLVRWRGTDVSAATMLAEIDVLVVPSRRDPGTVATLEALVAGVPVLAANSGGMRDVVSSTKNGWLFRSGDPHDLARALIMLVESDALRTVNPQPGPGWRFAADAVAAQWAQIYGRVLGVNTSSAATSLAR